MNQRHLRIGRCVLGNACAVHQSLVALATCTFLAVPSGSAVSSGVSVQPAPSGIPSGEPLRLVFSPWVKLCDKQTDPEAKRVCVTTKDGRQDDGRLIVSVAVIERDGEQKKILRVSLPYGVALLHGTRLIVDQQQPSTAPFVTCLPPAVPPGGCIADYEATTDLIGRMKEAQLLTVQAIHMNGQAMSPQLELKDFASAYDGPPTDPKTFGEQQRKRQNEQQKRIRDDTLQPHLRR